LEQKQSEGKTPLVYFDGFLLGSLEGETELMGVQNNVVRREMKRWTETD